MFHLHHLKYEEIIHMLYIFILMLAWLQVLLSEKFDEEYRLAQKLEFLTDKLQTTYRELEAEKTKTDK